MAALPSITRRWLCGSAWGPDRWLQRDSLSTEAAWACWLPWGLPHARGPRACSAADVHSGAQTAVLRVFWGTMFSLLLDVCLRKDSLGSADTAKEAYHGGCTNLCSHWPCTSLFPPVVGRRAEGLRPGFHQCLPAPSDPEPWVTWTPSSVKCSSKLLIID